MTDLIIIGGGPGGYVCAIRAAQLGLSVVLVERRCQAGKTRLGGTCLNVGCIPSKALLDSSERYAEARRSLEGHGVLVEGVRLDLARMLARKQRVVDGLVDGLSYLMKKNRIEVVSGSGRLLGPGRVQVEATDGSRRELTAKQVVLAMGSVPIDLPSVPWDGDLVVTSDQAIAFDRVPQRLVVVGGGAIGLELGSVWSRLGSEVTVVESMPQLCPFLDGDVAGELQKSLSRQGLKILLGTRITGLERRDGAGLLTALAPDGSSLELPADRVLVAVGRRPLVEEAGLAEAGVALTERRRVRIDHDFRTTVPGVFALGDLVDGPMLAHKAEDEGVAVAEIIAGQPNPIDHALVPSVVYTEPEVASVGLTETEAERRVVKVRTGRFPFAAVGRARAAGVAEGFVKLISHAETDRLLGCAIIGPRASDLIIEAVATLAYGGSAEDLARTCHAHPTYAEAIKEAALDSLGRAIHQ